MPDPRNKLKRKRLKLKNQPEVLSSGRVTADVPAIDPAQLRPVFSFDRLIPPRCDVATRGRYLDHFVKLAQMTWNDIQQAPREGLGFELIPIRQCHSTVQQAVPPDLAKLMVFRLSNVGRVGGYRVRETFFVIVLDHDHSAY